MHWLVPELVYQSPFSRGRADRAGPDLVSFLVTAFVLVLVLASVAAL